VFVYSGGAPGYPSYGVVSPFLPHAKSFPDRCDNAYRLVGMLSCGSNPSVFGSPYCWTRLCRLAKIYRVVCGLAQVSHVSRGRLPQGLIVYTYRYITLFGWSLAIQITFPILIQSRTEKNATDGDNTDLGFIQKLVGHDLILHCITKLTLLAVQLFGICICVTILVAEKFAIQSAGLHFDPCLILIEFQIHRGEIPREILRWHVSLYRHMLSQRAHGVHAERIDHQKFAVRVLTVLYQNSRDIPGREGGLDTAMKGEAGSSRLKLPDRKKLLKRAFRGVRFAATSTTTALGNVASEMLGRQVCSC
jgi:hypothetical protein